MTRVYICDADGNDLAIDIPLHAAHNALRAFFGNGWEILKSPRSCARLVIKDRITLGLVVWDSGT